MARCDISLLNFVVSDGRSLIATRYVSNADEAPASLYYAEGSGYEREQRVPEASAKLSAAAKALHGTESMEGVAGARSRPVTGVAGGGGAWPASSVTCLTAPLLAGSALQPHAAGLSLMEGGIDM